MFEITQILKKLLVICSLLLALPTLAKSFQDDATGLWFETTGDTTCTITKPSSGIYSMTEVEIPATVVYNNVTYNVTAISSNAFDNDTSLAFITIPDGVTTIGNGAFENCTSLTSVTIPDRVTAIGQYAFSNCSALMILIMSDNLEKIGDYAFKGCQSLIGMQTIYDDQIMTMLVIPDKVVSIGEEAFASCPALENVWLGFGLTSIGKKAFNTDSQLKLIVSAAKKAPILAAQNVFDNDTYKNAELKLATGETDEETAEILTSYSDTTGNYWYLFLSDYVTGVDSLNTNGITINTIGRSVVINGYDGVVAIYNMSGSIVYQGYANNNIELPTTGVYIVKIVGTSHNIAIK